MSPSKLKIVTPAAPINNRTLRSNSKSSENSISTNDLMSTLQSFRTEFLESTKSQSSVQISQFNEIKRNIQKLSSLITELKAENTQLKDEINILKNKVEILESTESVVHSNSLLSQILQQISERELCAHNVLVYRLSESSSTSAPQRISHDKIALDKTLGQYSSIIPKSTIKLVRLGKMCQDHIHPLKIIFQSKDEPINFIRGFTNTKLSGAMFPTNFRIIRDKTIYEYD
jgi:predicted nuclease with TOPRIM domain